MVIVKYEKLRRRRVEKGLSMKQIAETMGLTYRSYWNKEAGKTEITITEANKLAEILGADLNSLFG